MSEKKRQKKDGEDKNKDNRRERDANNNQMKTQDRQAESGRNPDYK